MRYLKIIQLVSFLTLSGFVFQAQAQRIDLSVDYGYQLGTKLNYGGSNYLKASDGGFFSGMVGLEVGNGTMLELTYMNMQTDLLIRDVLASPTEDRLSDLVLDWIQIGGSRYFDTGSDITPFIGMSGGVTIFTPKNENFDIVNNSLPSSTQFSFLIKGGAIYNVSDVVGIKVQADLMFPVSWGGVYYGAFGSVYSGGTTVMGAFSAGLVFTLGG